MPAEILIGGVGLFLVWTGTAVGFAYWMNNKFNGLLPTSDYSARHDKLEDRVRALEVKTARLCERVKV